MPFQIRFERGKNPEHDDNHVDHDGGDHEGGHCGVSAIGKEHPHGRLSLGGQFLLWWNSLGAMELPRCNSPHWGPGWNWRMQVKREPARKSQRRTWGRWRGGSRLQ